MKRWLVTFVIVGLLCVWIPSAEPQAPPARPKSLMQMKLDHAQQILEGLTVENFEQIARHAAAMNDLSLREQWEHSGVMAYQTQLKVFRFANNELERLAKEKSLDGAMLAYTQMTISCVNCHKIVRSQPAE